MTHKEIIAAGWIQLGIDHSKTFLRSIATYKKDNYFMVLYHDEQYPFPTIHIMANDPVKECWTLYPEQFRIMVPCPTIELLNSIYDALIKGKQEINVYEL